MVTDIVNSPTLAGTQEVEASTGKAAEHFSCEARHRQKTNSPVYAEFYHRTLLQSRKSDSKNLAHCR
jgi:hypothetical protein